MDKIWPWHKQDFGCIRRYYFGPKIEETVILKAGVVFRGYRGHGGLSATTANEKPPLLSVLYV